MMEKVKRFFGKVGKILIPLKGDRPLEIARKSVFIASVITGAVCLALILSDLNANQRSEAAFAPVIDAVEDYLLTGEIRLSAERAEEIREEVPQIMDKLVAAYDAANNTDMIGWVNIPGSVVNYPVLQYRHEDENGRITGSNHYYLEHDINHNKSKIGAIYAEWRFPFTPHSRPDNTVLYGHNIGAGSMFATVARYHPLHWANATGLDYYLKAPVVEFDTLYTEGSYKIFAVIFVHTEEDKYDDVYDYFRKREFPDRETFYDFMQNIMDRSGFYTDVDIEYGDEILTFSTCYYPLGEDVDSRVALFARRVRGDESEHVNTDKAYVNPSPLYFKRYYQAMGGGWGGRSWDTSLIRGLDEYLTENPDKNTETRYFASIS